MRVALLVLAAACGGAPAAVEPPRPVAAPASAAPAPAAAPAPRDRVTIPPERTAGLYWLPYETCYDCARPAALVAYVTRDTGRARRIRAALAGSLGFGLPYVIHSDEIGLSPRGIAIVAGTFASVDRARGALANAAAVEGVAPRVVALSSEGYAEGRAAPESPLHVTQVDRGGPVPAWSKADVEAVSAALDETTDPDARSTLASMHAWVQRKLRERTPLCTVKPGDLFVVEDDELKWYELAPVRCGGKLAYIPWTSSLLGHATIVSEGDGYRLFQVVGAECDSPIIEDWRYDATGRHTAHDGEPLVASAGC